MRILIHFSICIIFGLILREDPKPEPSTQAASYSRDSLQLESAQDSMLTPDQGNIGQEWARR